MNDRPGMSSAENWNDPEASVPPEEDPITAFIRSSLRAAHPPGRIAMTLEQHSPGLGRAYLGPIHAIARDMGAGRRPEVSRPAVLSGSFSGGMPVASDAPPAAPGGWLAGRETPAGLQAPVSLFANQSVPQIRRTGNVSLVGGGLPLRSAALPVKKATAGLLQPLAAKAKPVGPLRQDTPSTPPNPQGPARKRRYRYPIDDLSVELTANATADPYQHPGYLGFIGSTAESGGGKHLISDGSKDPRGGTSYGRNQLSSKTGTMKEFLEGTIEAKFGQKFAKDFKGNEPGSKEFNDIYRQLTKTRGAELEEAEHNFLYTTRYLPVANEAEAVGFDLKNRAVQEAIWSTAIQRGRKGGIEMIKAIAAAGVPKDTDSMIDRLYEARIKHAPSQWERFSAERDKVKEFARNLREISVSKSPLRRRR